MFRRYICDPGDGPGTYMCYAEVKPKLDESSSVAVLRHMNIGMLYTKISHTFFGLSVTSVRSPRAIFSSLHLDQSEWDVFLTKKV